MVRKPSTVELQTIVVVGGFSVSHLCNGSEPVTLSSHKKGQKQNVCKNLTKIANVFLSFLFWLRGKNLVMELPWIQIGFECYDGIRIPYMEKNLLVRLWRDSSAWCWYVMEKKEPWGRDPMWGEYNYRVQYWYGW